MHSIDNLIVVGDRVLIKPKTAPEKTRSGLLLPAGYNEKEPIQSGYVMKCGPGIPIPVSKDPEEEPWKTDQGSDSQYIPPQAQVGDLALFLQKSAVEIVYGGEKYFIVPNSAILLLERNEL